MVFLISKQRRNGMTQYAASSDGVFHLKYAFKNHCICVKTHILNYWKSFWWLLGLENHEKKKILEIITCMCFCGQIFQYSDKYLEVKLVNHMMFGFVRNYQTSFQNSSPTFCIFNSSEWDFLLYHIHVSNWYCQVYFQSL